jgi:SPP1 gp7 family putative phage head morphogenesis protein
VQQGIELGGDHFARFAQRVEQLAGIVDLSAPNYYDALLELIKLYPEIDQLTYELNGTSLQELLQKNTRSTYNLASGDALNILRGMRVPVTERLMHEDLVKSLASYASNFLRDLAADEKGRLSETLYRGYSHGESVPKLRNRVIQVLNVEKPKATALARTMTNETYNQAHLARYKEAGFQGVQWVAAHNEKTCPLCSSLDKHIWSIDDPGMIRPPLHFQCRCRLAGPDQ